MFVFNYTFVLSVIFPNSFSENHCSLLSVASIDWVPCRHRHGHRKHVPMCGVYSAACSLVATSLMNGHCCRLQACVHEKRRNALLFCSHGTVWWGGATQMSLPASDVTNRIRVPHRLQLHFVAPCTAIICFSVRLSFHYQGSVLLVCSINLSILLWG
jgi:hypothetical protein